MTMSLSRRDFLKAGAGLIVEFQLAPYAYSQTPQAQQTGAPPARPIDAWLAIDAEGQVTVFCGKVELGTGIETAMAQLVAEELDVAFPSVHLVMGDTARSVNQGPTVGSKTLQQGGPQLRRAAAEARLTLLAMAAEKLAVAAEQLRVADGVVSAPNGSQVSYAQLVGGKRFARTVGDTARLKSPADFRIVGREQARVDIPGKVTGSHNYLHDFRLAGMLHGRVIRPNAIGAKLKAVDEASVNSLPGNVRVVVKGNFVGVVAEREEQAIAAAAALKIVWTPPASGLPAMSELEATMRRTSAETQQMTAAGDVDAALKSAARTLTASYRTPYQSHGSIGPSCAVAEVKDGRLTVWSATQGSWMLAGNLATLLGLPPAAVRVIWMEGSGCYGHNGADDVAADAALLSQALSRPVRVQWMRSDEHGWDPKGPAMIVDLRGGLAADQRIVAWDYQVITPTHSSRPAGGAGGNLLAGLLQGMAPRLAMTGGNRNAPTNYQIPNHRVTVHWLKESVLRASALRGLGAPQNTFANESFIDELAADAGADPIAFRLKHLAGDSRAIDLLAKVREISGWTPRPSPSTSPRKVSGPVLRGRGVAFARYENEFASAAVVVEVAVDRKSGMISVPKVHVAHDCGLIVNPDGLKNQIEGNIIQTLSRALKEQVTFDRNGVTSVDWVSYPILRFSEIPEDINIALLNHPEDVMYGAGEATAVTVFAAVANALFDATGVRLRSVPFTAADVLRELAHRKA